MSGPNIQNSDVANDFALDPKHIDEVIYIKDIDAFGWYDAERGYFEILDQDKMQERIYFYALEKGRKGLTKQITADIVQQIKWTIKRKVKSIVTNYIAFKDKLLNLNTFEFEDFDVKKYAFNFIDVLSTEINTQDPVTFKKYLETTLVTKDLQTDTELINVVQEMFGFYFINDLKAESVFFLVGDGANGKSRMTEVIENIVGERFTSNMSIEEMTMDKFATSDLVGKKINICREEESKFVKSSLFKALVTGDTISAVRKFGARFSFKPTAKQLYASNNPPTFEGAGYALTRRIKIIPFNRKFKPEEKDVFLEEKLKKELPGIVAWTIEGAKRLIANNYCFSYSKQMEAKTREFESNLSSAVMYVREKWVEHESGFVPNDDLYADYVLWCSLNGRKAMNSHNFFKDIANTLVMDSALKYHGDKGKTVRGRLLRPFSYD